MTKIRYSINNENEMNAFIQMVQKLEATLFSQSYGNSGGYLLAIAKNGVQISVNNMRNTERAVFYNAILQEFNPIEIDLNSITDNSIEKHDINELLTMSIFNTKMCSCGQKSIIGGESKYCPYCGKQLTLNTITDPIKVCYPCEHLWHHNYSYCPKCSNPLENLHTDILSIDSLYYDEHFLVQGANLDFLDINLFEIQKLSDNIQPNPFSNRVIAYGCKQNEAVEIQLFESIEDAAEKNMKKCTWYDLNNVINLNSIPIPARPIRPGGIISLRINAHEHTKFGKIDALEVR